MTDRGLKDLAEDSQKDLENVLSPNSQTLETVVTVDTLKEAQHLNSDSVLKEDHQEVETIGTDTGDKAESPEEANSGSCPKGKPEFEDKQRFQDEQEGHHLAPGRLGSDPLELKEPSHSPNDEPELEDKQNFQGEQGHHLTPERLGSEPLEPKEPSHLPGAVVGREDAQLGDSSVVPGEVHNRSSGEPSEQNPLVQWLQEDLKSDDLRIRLESSETLRRRRLVPGESTPGTSVLSCYTLLLRTLATRVNGSTVVI